MLASTTSAQRFPRVVLQEGRPARGGPTPAPQQWNVTAEQRRAVSGVGKCKSRFQRSIGALRVAAESSSPSPIYPARECLTLNVRTECGAAGGGWRRPQSAVVPEPRFSRASGQDPEARWRSRLALAPLSVNAPEDAA
jgi:hypothetical protein